MKPQYCSVENGDENFEKGFQSDGASKGQEGIGD